MPGAAFTAAKGPQEQEKQDCPLRRAMAARTRDILAPAQGALPRTYPKRNCVRSGHKLYMYRNPIILLHPGRSKRGIATKARAWVILGFRRGVMRRGEGRDPAALTAYKT